jgi:hypothetical protein
VLIVSCLPDLLLQADKIIANRAINVKSLFMQDLNPKYID